MCMRYLLCVKFGIHIGTYYRSVLVFELMTVPALDGRTVYKFILFNEAELFLVLLAFVTFSTVYNNNGYIFIGGNQDYTCQVPSNNVTADGEGYLEYIAGGDKSQTLLVRRT